MDADLKLITRAVQGEAAAFERIVDLYLDTVYNLALRIVNDRDDAMDITQSVFIKLYENLRKYDPAHKLFSWLYRMTINEALNAKRRRRFKKLPEDLESPLPNPEQRRIRSESAGFLLSALETIKPEYRIVLVLRHFKDLSYHDIGEILQIPEKTVKSRLYTGRHLLKLALVRRGYGR